MLNVKSVGGSKMVDFSRLGRACAPVSVALAAIFSIATPVAEAAIVQQTLNQVADFTVSGTDLLTGATPSPTDSGNSQEGSSTAYSTLVDGVFGSKGTKSEPVTPANASVVVFTLAVPAPSIKQVITYAGWPDGGRDDQRYVLAYSTTTSPGTFIDIATVNNATTGNAAPDSAQRVTIFDDTGADIATNVAALRFTFTDPQENNYVGYREFDAFATPVPEPTMLGMLGLGAVGLLARRRRSAEPAI